MPQGADVLPQNSEAVVYVWPEDFPAQCPPSEATELNGSVFRFTNRPQPHSNDFLSHYERDQEKDWSGFDLCIIRGLSVMRTYQDCLKMRAGVPAMRKKRIAQADIDAFVGLIASTPSRACGGHCTWWRDVSPAQAAELFVPFNETDGEA
jgi:hypothetical protein